MATGSGNDLAEDYETPGFSSRASLDMCPIFLLIIIFRVTTVGYPSLSIETGADGFAPGRNRRHYAKEVISTQAGNHRVRETVDRRDRAAAFPGRKSSRPPAPERNRLVETSVRASTPRFSPTQHADKRIEIVRPIDIAAGLQLEESQARGTYPMARLVQHS